MYGLRLLVRRADNDKDLRLYAHYGQKKTEPARRGLHGEAEGKKKAAQSGGSDATAK